MLTTNCDYYLQTRLGSINAILAIPMNSVHETKIIGEIISKINVYLKSEEVRN